MKKLRIPITSLLFLAFCLLQIEATAQENEETVYWYTSDYKLDWTRLDSLSKLVTMYTVPIAAQAKKNGDILDYKLFFHDTGDANNVIIMVKYPSWSAMRGNPWVNKAFEEIEPDKAKRDAVYASFNWCMEGSTHTDNIYLDGMHKGEQAAKN